jgi:hypothetical protein
VSRRDTKKCMPGRRQLPVNGTNNTIARDAVIAVLSAVLALGLLAYAIATLGQRPTPVLTGVILEKELTPGPEQQISFGKKGLKAEPMEGEYVLKVRVEKENRVFEVPVEKVTYEGKKVGDSLTFLRPPSERR